VTYFNPLFSSPGGFPANGGSNFGIFSSPTVNNLIKQALSQPTEPEADKFWAQADMQVMKEAAIYPISSPQQLMSHASYVHNAVYLNTLQNFDAANVWLSNTGG
jgi:peptide/nickel transport system substrate-binding protein